MNFNEAKSELKEKYIEFGLDLLDEHPEDLLFSLNKTNFMVTRERIQSYADFHSKANPFDCSIECAICTNNYYEHIVAPSDPLSFFSLPENKDITFGQENEIDPYVKISGMSDDFFNCYSFNTDFIRSYFWKHRFDSRFSPILNKSSDIRGLFPKIITIKVNNLKMNGLEEARSFAMKLGESCLFQLAYLKGSTLWFLEQWRHKKPNKPNFSLVERFQGYNYPLMATFQSEPIKFYQQGISSRVPELQYLAFYQVLEFFFQLVSKEKLFEQVGSQLRDPGFKPSNSRIDHLVQTIDKYKHETDELKMLINVLNKFIDEQEIIDFIKKYEDFLSSNIYTKKHAVFGVEDIEVPLRKDHTTSNIAKHIKETRNAIVHSTDKYENNARHVPYTKSTKSIELDIPLVKFLAEKVIIASSTNL